MSRTSHRYHIETCPHCGRQEKVQNRSYRWVAPNNVIGAVTAYDLSGRAAHGAGGTAYESRYFRRTTVHRIACAKKREIDAYDS